MKRALSLFLCLVLLSGMLSLHAFADTPDENHSQLICPNGDYVDESYHPKKGVTSGKWNDVYYYEYNSSKQSLTLTKQSDQMAYISDTTYSGTGFDTANFKKIKSLHIVAPFNISGFEGWTSLETVTIDNVFERACVTKGAFKNCTSLKNVDFLAINDICENAFENCVSLTGVLDFYSNLYSVEAGAFNGCTGLTGLRFNDSLTGYGSMTLAPIADVDKVTIYCYSWSKLTMLAEVGHNVVYLQAPPECTDGHSYIYDSWENGEYADCTHFGIRIELCSICGAIRKTKINAYGHSFNEFGVCSNCLLPLEEYLEMLDREKASQNSSGFADVPDGKWYTAAVVWAVEQGVTNGTSELKFSPDKGCTRAEIVTFLWRLAGYPEPELRHTYDEEGKEYTEIPYYDVHLKSYFFKAVCWAKQNNITTGTSELYFSPFDECTRAQIVTLLWRYYGKPDVEAENSFTDVKGTEYFAKAVFWAIENNITKGISDTEFAPNQTCTRAQAVTFLYRAFNNIGKNVHARADGGLREARRLDAQEGNEGNL